MEWSADRERCSVSWSMAEGAAATIGRRQPRPIRPQRNPCGTLVAIGQRMVPLQAHDQHSSLVDEVGRDVGVADTSSRGVQP